MFVVGQKKDEQPNQGVKEQMAPALGKDEMAFGGDVMALKILGSGSDILVEKNTAAVAVQLEFFNSLGQAAKMTEQLVLLLPSKIQILKPAVHQQPVAQTTREDQDEKGEQYFPGEPAEIGRAPQQNGDIHSQNRQA